MPSSYCPFGATIIFLAGETQAADGVNLIEKEDICEICGFMQKYGILIIRGGWMPERRQGADKIRIAVPLGWTTARGVQRGNATLRMRRKLKRMHSDRQVSMSRCTLGAISEAA